MRALAESTRLVALRRQLLSALRATISLIAVVAALTAGCSAAPTIRKAICASPSDCLAKMTLPEKEFILNVNQPSTSTAG
jgi:hypothetical protein